VRSARWARGRSKQLSLGGLDRAIAEFTQAITLDPKSAAAYNNRGLAYHRKRDLDRAIADFTQAIPLDPKFAVSYYNRGNVYADKGDHDRAITDFNQAITLDPKYAVAYHNRGNSYGAKGDHNRAIADFTQAITLDPKDALAYANRGIDYAAEGDRDRAMADYNQAITLNPQFAGAYNNRGLAYAAKGDYERTIADYDQAIRLDPANGPARRNRARAQAALTARQAPSSPPAQAPDQPVTYYGLTFPAEIGGGRRGDVHDYETTHPGLGYSVGYRHRGAQSTVYIYDGGLPWIPDDLHGSVVTQQLEQSRLAIRRGRPDGAVEDKGQFAITDSQRRPSLICDRVVMKNGIRGDDPGVPPIDSFVCLGVVNGKFFKVRTSMPQRPDSEAEVRSFVGAWVDRGGASDGDRNRTSRELPLP
jgi:tetratricopeptide (TPR) repeat protein